MLIPENEYERDMIVAGGRLKHEYTHNLDEKIVLSDGKTFAKNVQQVFPAEFTAWISSKKLFKLTKQTPSSFIGIFFSKKM